MAKKVIQAQMQQRRDTAAQWAASNPVLLEGELGIVTDDPNLYKIGDGVTAWNDLKFRGFDGTLVQTLGDSENAVMSQKAVTSKLTELESDTKEYLYNSAGLRGETYIDSADNATWKQLVNNLSIKAGQKCRLVINSSMNQWSRIIVAYNNSNNRLKDLTVYLSTFTLDFTATEDISSFEVFVNGTSGAQISWVLYADSAIQELEASESLKAKLVANGILSTSIIGNEDLYGFVKTDIKKGEKWEFKVESASKIWTRLILVANSNNSLRILDSSDTSIEGKWFASVAEYDITDLGLYVIAPTADTYSITYKMVEGVEEDIFKENVENMFAPIIELHGKNLLNPYTAVDGYLRDNGEIVAYNGLVTSDYIPVPKGTTLFIESFRKLAIYNKTKEIQGGFIDADVYNHFYVAADDSFVRITTRDNAYKMVAYSTSVITYEPYRATIEQGVTLSDAQISQVVSLLPKANGGALLLQKNGNVYKFSSNGISMNCAVDEGRNGVFNFSSVSCYGDEITQGDDIAPIHAIGTTIGANHAHPCWMATINGHSKTSANIGETWVDASNKSFCLVAVTDVNKIVFIGVNLNETLSAGAITHDGETMTISSVSSTQMYPSVKNLSHRILQNGSNEIIEDGEFACQYVDVVEQYDIMLTSSTITKLLAGGKTYDGDAFVRIINTYRIMENCNTLVFVSLIPLMSFSFSDAMFSQAIRQGNNGSVAYYLPNSKPASHNFTKPLKLTFSDALSGLYIGSSYWKDASNPINRVIQIGANHGFAIGFIPVGVGENLEQYTANTFEIRNNTGKIYPHGVESSKVGSTLQVGKAYSVGMYRCYFPLNKLGDKVSLYHYNLNGVEYVYADFSHEGVENLAIGTDFNGKKVEVVESSNVNLITSMYNNGVMVNVDYTDNDTSYIVLKFVA